MQRSWATNIDKYQQNYYRYS